MKTKYEKAIEEYHLLKPFRYRSMVKMSLSYAQAYTSIPLLLELDLELCINFEDSEPHLMLHFSGVQELKFIPLGGPPILIGDLEIFSIHERQWENLHYAVDAEESVLKFFCKDFSASIVG